jgi:hypothetical protein
MKIQIARLSVLQNAKVVSILMAVWTFLFLIPFYLIAHAFMPAVDGRGNPTMLPPLWIVFVFPLIYLIVGFIFTILGCLVYNMLAKVIGGFEYEPREEQ